MTRALLRRLLLLHKTHLLRRSSKLKLTFSFLHSRLQKYLHSPAVDHHQNGMTKVTMWGTKRMNSLWRLWVFIFLTKDLMLVSASLTLMVCYCRGCN